MKCKGDRYSTCGGSATFQLFHNPANSPAQVDAALLPQGWTDAGCRIEGQGGRALKEYTFASKSMTVELCSQTCADKGFSLGECAIHLYPNEATET